MCQISSLECSLQKSKLSIRTTPIILNSCKPKFKPFGSDSNLSRLSVLPRKALLCQSVDSIAVQLRQGNESFQSTGGRSNAAKVTRICSTSIPVSTSRKFQRQGSKDYPPSGEKPMQFKASYHSRQWCREIAGLNILAGFYRTTIISVIKNVFGWMTFALTLMTRPPICDHCWSSPLGKGFPVLNHAHSTEYVCLIVLIRHVYWPVMESVATTSIGYCRWQGFFWLACGPSMEASQHMGICSPLRFPAQGLLWGKDRLRHDSEMHLSFWT